MEEFKKLGLSKKTIQILEKKGFTEPTTIQTKVIPLLLEGKKDVVGQSQTGTGKTASFALPIIERIKEHSKTVQAIVLTPTRELALQVAKEIDSLKGDKKIHVLAVYGGAPIDVQRQKLRRGVDIVVGTPGRVMDLQRRKSLVLDDIQYAVLDEADEMLNMGFVEDIEMILQNTPKDKSMLLFSATMPRSILKIAEKYMKKYELIEIEKSQVITKTVEQIYYDINAKDRFEGIRRIVDSNLDFHGIVFCNTRAAVDTLTQQLTKVGYRAASLHGDITQAQREKILQQFRVRSVRVLVATDVAARGIDVEDLTHVINFSLPQSPELYVHRIGRTGRAGKKGVAVTFVIPSERGKLRFVERINKCQLTKQQFPSAKEIVKAKEAQVKDMVQKIISSNKGKSPRYNSIAEELLLDNKPEEVVSAILKYSLKNELDVTTYKEISEAKSTGSRSRSDSDRGGFRRGRASSRRDRGRSESRSGDRGRSGGRSNDRRSNDRRSEGRSRERPSGRGRSERKPREGESRDGPKRTFGRSSDRKSEGRSERKPRESTRDGLRKAYGRPSDKKSEGRSGERKFERKSSDKKSKKPRHRDRK
jgi:ATP-dependent RNA helicase DeaD